MSIRYVLTITGAATVEEALTFYCDQVSMEYGQKACMYILTKGFKRMLLMKPEVNKHIDFRLNQMHPLSPTEFVWMGHDKDGKSTYILYGLLPSIFGKDMTGSKEPVI